jgi:hypothetical protein
VIVDDTNSIIEITDQLIGDHDAWGNGFEQNDGTVSRYG